MAALTGPRIEELVRTGDLVIDQFRPERVNPNSYNLCITRDVLMYEKGARVHDLYEEWWHEWEQVAALHGEHVATKNRPAPSIMPRPLKVTEEEPTVARILPKADEPRTASPRLVVERFWPGVLYLLCTEEYTETPYPYRPHLDGRSSIGRLGEFVHVTAGYGDVNFQGQWTLEVAVVQPVETHWPLEACQISYTRVEGPPKLYESKKYQGQRGGPRASRLFVELSRGK
jgi:deoxycytidine triphosphate deaminase